MKKITIIRIAALLGLAGCAFKTPEENTVNADLGSPKETKPFASHYAALESLVHGPWQGKLPCADCEGIAYQLTLQKDRTYEESSEYLGKNAAHFKEKGTWSITQDSVVVLTKPAGKTQFRFTRGGLYMLDQQGQLINAALAENYRISRVGGNGNNTGSNIWETKRKQGIDFVAMGNEPSWSLDIDFDKTITFQSLNEKLKLSAAVPSEQKLADGKGSVYRARTEAGTLTVRILNQPCTDKMSGETFPYTVEATANAQDYSGCGKYLEQEDPRLNDIWVLQEMNGKAINPADLMKGAPTLDLQLKPKKVYGHSGCNQISGNLEVKGNKITFGMLAGTRMACPGTGMTFEPAYLKLLSDKTFTYALEDSRLKLRDKGQVVLVYKKVD